MVDRRGSSRSAASLSSDPGLTPWACVALRVRGGARPFTLGESGMGRQSTRRSCFPILFAKNAKRMGHGRSILVCRINRDKDFTMRRRTFIQTLPLAAAASAVSMQSQAAGLGQSGVSFEHNRRASQISTRRRGALHPAGRSRGRPAFGRELCHALAGAGALGRGGHGASAGHADRHRDAEARRLRRGRGGGGQCRAGICGAGELRPGRRLLCVCVGPEGRQADGHGQLRQIAQSAHAGNGAGARR